MGDLGVYKGIAGHAQHYDTGHEAYGGGRIKVKGIHDGLYDEAAAYAADGSRYGGQYGYDDKYYSHCRGLSKLNSGYETKKLLKKKEGAENARGEQKTKFPKSFHTFNILVFCNKIVKDKGGKTFAVFM